MQKIEKGDEPYKMSSKTTSTTSVTSTGDKVSWFDGKFYKSCVAAMPFIRWAIIAIMFAFGAYIYQRDTNAQQVISNVDLQKEQDRLKQDVGNYKANTDAQFQTIRKEMLTRELAQAWRDADTARMQRIEDALNRLAERP